MSLPNHLNNNVDPNQSSVDIGNRPPCNQACPEYARRGGEGGVIGTLLYLKILLITLLPKITLAADEAKRSNIPIPDAMPGNPYPNDTTGTDIQQYFFDTFIPYFTKGFSGIVGAICIVAIVISGVQYLTAYTNEEQTQTAKKNLIWSCVGLVIAMISYAIVSIITNLPLPPVTPPTS